MKEKNTKETKVKEEETKEKEEETGDSRDKGECYRGTFFLLLFKYTHRFPHFLSIIL